MSLSTFGRERTVFWREASSGLSPLAYFLGKNIADLPRQLILPIFYLSMYYTLLQPQMSAATLYLIVFAGAFATWGMGYCVSAVLSPGLAQVGAIVLALAWTTLSGITPTRGELRQNLGGLGTALNSISYARWMTETLFVEEVASWPPGWAPETDAQMSTLGFDRSAKATGVAVLFAIGIISRVLAYVLMVVVARRKIE